MINTMMDYAHSLLLMKIPYKWGGYCPLNGLDCCLIGDTLIETDVGFKKISEFVGGERVKSIKNGKVCLNDVSKVFKNGIKEVFKLKTTDSTIFATSNHKFLVTSRDFSLPLNSINKSVKLEWKKLEDLKVKDILLMAANQERPHEIDLEENQLKFLGAMLGDGYINPDKRKFSLSFYEEEERNKASEWIINGFGYKNKITFNSTSGMYFYCAATTKKIISLNICNKKSPERSLPEWVFRLTNEQLNFFLEGYMKSDGSRIVRKTPRREDGCTVDSASKDLIEQLHILLLSRGHHVTNLKILKRNKPIFIKGKQVKNPQPSHRFTIYDSLNRLYPSKLNRYAEDSKNTPYDYLNLSKSFRFKTIGKIESAGLQETYDLTIDSSHNYFANGFVVHNSGFAQEVLASIGKDPIGDQTAQTLYEIMRVYCKEDIVRRGTILFFGRHKKEITHVAIAINDKYMYEAGGGGSSTTTWEEAIRKNAMVRIRPIRKDLVCFLNLE